MNLIAIHLYWFAIAFSGVAVLHLALGTVKRSLRRGQLLRARHRANVAVKHFQPEWKPVGYGSGGRRGECVGSLPWLATRNF